MGEFFAWAATGLVAGLEAWSEADGNHESYGYGAERGGRRSIITTRQRFFLRQREGRDIEVLLIDSGIAFRNGHAVTAVWAAGEGAPYGHCIYLENHTSGAIARLPDNILLIRPRAGFWRIAGFGFIVAFLAALMMLLWVVLQGGAPNIRNEWFWISGAAALFMLFIIGAAVAKLTFDYNKVNDDEKIWLAADRALANARRVLLQRPVLGRLK